MGDAVSPRQLGAFLLSALSAPMVAVCPKLPWPWVLALSVLAAALWAGLWAMQGRCPRPLPVLVRQVWGKKAGTAILAATVVFFLLLLWRLTPLMAQSFPESRSPAFVPLTLLALAAWACSRGRAATVRAVGVLFFFLAALYAAVFLFALPDADPSRLQSTAEVSLVPAGILLLPVLGMYLSGGQRGKTPPLPFLAVLILLPAAVSALCAAVPGSRGSFYEMAKSVEVFSVAQRIEPLVSALLTLGWFALAALLALCAGQTARACGISGRWASVIFCVLAVPGAVAELPVSDGFLLAFGTIFCVLIPLLTLFLGPQKIFEKKMKKGVDKGGSFC